MHLRTAFLGTVYTALVFASWLVLGPAVLGGPVVYTITSGRSMEPMFHAGDLAVLRTGRDAHVGDIFGYVAPGNRVVLHRVIGEDAYGYTFQGDNNSWVDTIRPKPDALIGRFWFAIPGAGRVMSWIREPLHAALIAGGTIAMAAFSQGPAGVPSPEPPRFGLRHRRHPMDALIAFAASPDGQTLIGILGAIAIAACLVGFAGWRLMPGERTNTVRHPYEQQGAFSYSAPSLSPEQVIADAKARSIGGPGEAEVESLRLYPLLGALLGPPVTTGEPLFVNVNPSMTTVVDYSFVSASPHEIHGTTSMQFTVGDITGWRRTFPVGEPTTFSGDRTSISFTYGELREFMTAFKDYETVTGHIPRYYTVAVVATIDIKGTINNHPFEDRFQPHLVFRVTPPNEIYVETAATQKQEAPGVPLPEAGADPYQTVQRGSLDRVETVPNTIPVLTKAVPVTLLRRSAGFIAFVGGLFALVGLGLNRIAVSRGEDFIIRALHGAHLAYVDGDHDNFASEERTHLTSFDDVLEIATLQGMPVLVGVDDETTTYSVHIDGHTYSYSRGGDPT